MKLDRGQAARRQAVQAELMWWFGPTMMLLFLAACGSIGYLVVRAVRPSRAIDILR
ncbi:MAG: hypothetical protein JOZ85_05240, partial [Betaproteobacteria bacterium]|nr:hypothetical protein [Betaproteobacteria bacterium]